MGWEILYSVMLGFFIVAYLQFVIMLAELMKGLGLKSKCLCSETTTVLSECTVAKLYDTSLYIFHAQ